MVECDFGDGLSRITEKCPTSQTQRSQFSRFVGENFEGCLIHRDVDPGTDSHETARPVSVIVTAEQGTCDDAVNSRCDPG